MKIDYRSYSDRVFEVAPMYEKVKLPFKISRLPTKRGFLCGFTKESLQSEADYGLYLAPPNRDRVWWSSWCNTYSFDAEYIDRQSRSFPIAFIEAVKGDDPIEIGRFFLLHAIQSICNYKPAPIGESSSDSNYLSGIETGILCKEDICAALLCSFGGFETGNKYDPQIEFSSRDQIIDSAFPEFRDSVRTKLDRYFKKSAGKKISKNKQ